jgi:hypothetical protein
MISSLVICSEAVASHLWTPFLVTPRKEAVIHVLQQNLQQENGDNASSPSAAVPLTFQLNASANATEMALSPPATPNFTSGVMTPVRRPGQELTAAALQAAYAATPTNGNAGGTGQKLGGNHGSRAQSGAYKRGFSLFRMSFHGLYVCVCVCVVCAYICLRACMCVFVCVRT